ncbi:glycerol ethanol, ferric requiring protein [Mortierella sp. AD094]|nr:glycerol ethanol, ferric requiring protein [Mortierella sp. AD094]
MEPTKEQETQKTLEQATQEQTLASGVPSEMSAMVNILAKSVQGMQGSLGGAYQSMANQLKQSMEMTQTMSNMMELFLVSSLTISSRIERNDRTDKPLLILTTENKSHFPIPGVSGIIRIGMDNNEDRKFESSAGSSATLLSSSVVTIKKGKKEPKEKEGTIYAQPHQQATEGQPQQSPLDVLGPGMRCVDVFELNLERFDGWIILVEASFISPGTGKKLSKKHECCVYLVDQCAIEWLPGSQEEELEGAYTSKMMTGPLRQVLKVPVTDGISVGKRFTLTPSFDGLVIRGYVCGISEDMQETDLLFCCEGDQEMSFYILERICIELNILGEHPEYKSDTMQQPSPREGLLGLHGFPAPLHPDLFNEPTGYEKALQEVKQYEDFTTIDWVQDAVRERYRQTTKATPDGSGSWSSYLYDSYEAGQAWVVVSLVGVVIGLNAAFIAICTEWLSDIKLGHCSYAWWLNQKFCCWGFDSEDGYCEDWSPWSSFGIIDYVFYLIFATSFAASAAFLVKRYARYAAGSGISEIKCILAGFIMKGYLGGWTLIIKSLGLCMTVAANLSVGKEGPSIHIACCAGHVVSRLFPKYQRSRAKSREIISASAAAGVAVAFGAPIGGVLFSFEEMSNHFPAKTMWRSFFCALVATVTLQTMNPYRTGKLVMFQVSYDRDWHFFEIIFFILLGIFGGLYGALIIKYNLKVQHVRKRYLADYGVIEAATLAFLTCTFAYWNIFMKIDMAESMSILFRECEGSEDYMGLCKPENTWKMVALLFFALIMRLATCTISYGAKVPAGIFVPSMAIGALFGRMIGLIVRAAQVSYPGFFLFSSCKPDVPCITPGTYAFLGAAAALGGVMRLTVCVVVIMFELTGALNYILPTMITLMVTKAVGDYFGRGGIADRYIRLNGYPFLDKEEHSFGIAVSQVMQKDVTILPASGTRLDRVERLLTDTNYQGFPVVEDSTSRTLIGYIGRSELRYVIDKAKRARNVSPMAHCFFRPGSMESRQHMDQGNTGGVGSLDNDAPSSMRPRNSEGGDVGTSSSGVGGGGSGDRGDSETNYVDFGPFIDQTPIAVHPKLPLETVMEFFKKMGPRVILIEHQGKLVGLITIKDLLKYITRTEALDEEEEEMEVPGRPFGRRLRRGDPDTEWASRQWWSSDSSPGGRHNHSRHQQSSSISSIGNGINASNRDHHDRDVSPTRSPAATGGNSRGFATPQHHVRSSSSSSSSPSGYGRPGAGQYTPQTSITRPGRSPSVGGMTLASSIGSFRERIELTENTQQPHHGERDVLFDHGGYLDDDEDLDDQDEDEVQLPRHGQK